MSGGDCVLKLVEESQEVGKAKKEAESLLQLPSTGSDAAVYVCKRRKSEWKFLSPKGWTGISSPAAGGPAQTPS